MLTNQEINRLNKFLENKTFNYQGLMIFNTRTMVDLDYKFEIIGYKQMISVGQYYDYINISLTIFNFRDKLSQLIFSSNDTKEQEFWKSFFDNNLFFFKQQILGDIRNILINFDPNIKIHIGKINIELPEKENIQEQKMTRYAIRNVVKDIVKILKTEEEGDYTLPDNDYGGGYEFDRFPVEFSVDLYVSHDDSFDGYKLNAEYSPEDDTIEISIVYNPSDLKTSLYEIIGELNEVLAHELEHSLQEYRGEFDDDDEEETDPLKYYLQAHEIPAQVAGFKRLSRLRKVPFETVVRNWFKTHGEIHQLNDKEQKIVINKLLKYKKP
jgi:hypothetical protein